MRNLGTRLKKNKITDYSTSMIYSFRIRERIMEHLFQQLCASSGTGAVKHPVHRITADLTKDIQVVNCLSIYNKSHNVYFRFYYLPRRLNQINRASKRRKQGNIHTNIALSIEADLSLRNTSLSGACGRRMSIGTSPSDSQWNPPAIR